MTPQVGDIWMISMGPNWTPHHVLVTGFSTSPMKYRGYDLVADVIVLEYNITSKFYIQSITEGKKLA
jgi:hypothetical protein